MSFLLGSLLVFYLLGEFLGKLLVSLVQDGHLFRQQRIVALKSLWYQFSLLLLTDIRLNLLTPPLPPCPLDLVNVEKVELAIVLAKSICPLLDQLEQHT